MQGINLLDRQAVEARETIFGEVFTHNAVDVHRPAANLMYRWCIDGWWKLIWPNPELVPDAAVELFNVEADPMEHENLAPTSPARVNSMKAAIQAWWPATDVDAAARPISNKR
jgi:uncharacterized sulfatase